jgi:mRNA-degrading endonuclease YafQ of YafQ-DinJ toxin-antitoxin module
MTEGYRTLRSTPRFVSDLIGLPRTEQKQIAKWIKVLDDNEKTPSLRVHELQGQLQGIWTAAASKSLRITFVRLDGGYKLLLTVDHHDGD